MKHTGKLLIKTMDMYGVFLRGGSIGEVANNSQKLSKRINGRNASLCKTFTDKEEAMEYAKRRRGYLSKGEKSYYRMGYNVVKLSDKEIALVG